MPAQQLTSITVKVPVRYLDWLKARAEARGSSVESLLSDITTAALIAVRRAYNRWGSGR